MAIGFGDVALADGGAGLCALDFMRFTALGGGEGTLNCGSSLTGDALPCFFIVPPGGCAVFILEYGAHFDLGFSLTGVLSFVASDPLYPSFSYA